MINVQPISSLTSATNAVGAEVPGLQDNAVKKFTPEILASTGILALVNITGNKLLFVSPFSDTMNLVREIDYRRDNSFTDNPSLNFVQEYLSDNTGDYRTIDTLLKTSADDVCPIKLNGSYGAANHGWNKAYTLTKTAHGKTLADVGSVYKDTLDKEFVILRIVDANNLWIISKNQSLDGFTYTFIAPTGTLTYVTNGANTGSISSYSTAALAHIYPSSGESTIEMLMNGKEAITADGEYYGDFIDIRESYDVIDLPSMIDQIIDNRPTGGYLTPVFFNELDAEALFSNTIVYRIHKNGSILISQTFTAKKKLIFEFDGFIQGGPLSSGNIYVPKTLPINGGNKVYDLTLIEGWSTPPTNSLDLTEEYWEIPESPPDRVINMNSDVIYHYGYVTDRGVNVDRADHLTIAIELNNTRKIYPFAIFEQQTIDPFVNYSAVSFRAISNPDLNPAGRTSYTSFELGTDVFIYLDYHGSLIDYIEAEADWFGLKIEVIEKSDNVTLLQDVVTNSIGINADVDTYGYAVLKISK